MHRRFIVILMAASLMVGLLSACARESSSSVRLGSYMGHLCEAIGQFERDSHRLGRVTGRQGLSVKSRADAQELSSILRAVILDSRHVVRVLEATGAPAIPDGRRLAAGITATFGQISASDEAWRSRLANGEWSWPRAAVGKREHLGTSLGGLVLVGHQIERLPFTRERREAMVRSAVCRYVFGPVRVGEQTRA